MLNGIGVFIGANNWFFVWGGEGGWPFLPSPILLVQGKLSRTKVNLLTQQLAVWWHQLVSKVTRNANDGVMKYPKDIFTQFTFLFYFIIMIRLHNRQTVFEVLENDTSPQILRNMKLLPWDLSWLRFVWDPLILLKLKTFYWKYCR